MFIDANEIIKLIEAAKDCQERLPENEQWLHFRDVEGFLQKLIDDEADRLDKMAEELLAEEDDPMMEHYAELESGRAVMDWSAQEKLMDDETRKLQDWPGGV